MTSTFIYRVLFLRTPSSKTLWRITWPMILANISVPMLGFVDTAVIGHLSHPSYLAGTALGSLLVTVLFWLLGFLRMSTTGLIAQSNNDIQQQKHILSQGLVWSFLLSAVILFYQQSLFQGLLLLVEQSELSLAIESARQYFSTRIWITPIALANLVFAGFFIGRGLTKFVLLGVLLTNIINLILDILFVPVLQMGVTGVALASVIAESILFLFYLFGVNKHLTGFSTIFNSIKLDFRLISLNLTLFSRSLLLQLCLSFITIYATRYGNIAVAANAIIMQFFLFISFSLDGVAFALESLVGKSAGNKEYKKMRLYIRTGISLATVFALFYTLIYLGFHNLLFNLLTSLESIKVSLNEYVIWIVLLPIVSYMSFVMDGIFVGLAWSKQMLFTMFLAAVTFFLVFYFAIEMENQGLWLAFCCFMFMRGLSQVILFNSNRKKLFF